MSRVGKSPVKVPSGVEVKVDGDKVTAKGKLEPIGVHEKRPGRDDGERQHERNLAGDLPPVDQGEIGEVHRRPGLRLLGEVEHPVMRLQIGG